MTCNNLAACSYRAMYDSRSVGYLQREGVTGEVETKHAQCEAQQAQRSLCSGLGCASPPSTTLTVLQTTLGRSFPTFPDKRQRGNHAVGLSAADQLNLPACATSSYRLPVPSVQLPTPQRQTPPSTPKFALHCLQDHIDKTPVREVRVTLHGHPLQSGRLQDRMTTTQCHVPYIRRLTALRLEIGILSLLRHCSRDVSCSRPPSGEHCLCCCGLRRK